MNCDVNVKCLARREWRRARFDDECPRRLAADLARWPIEKPNGHARVDPTDSLSAGRDLAPY
jgi:hypothetical protein